jgi:hypothetical protein
MFSSHHHVASASDSAGELRQHAGARAPHCGHGGELPLAGTESSTSGHRSEQRLPSSYHTQIKVGQEQWLPQVLSPPPSLHSVGEPSASGFESDEPLSLFIPLVLAARHHNLVDTARVDHGGQQGSIPQLEGLT